MAEGPIEQPAMAPRLNPKRPSRVIDRTVDLFILVIWALLQRSTRRKCYLPWNVSWCEWALIRYDLCPSLRDPGVLQVDETITSFLMIVALGATVGVIAGSIALFFGIVLWNNIEEVPDDPEADVESSKS